MRTTEERPLRADARRNRERILAGGARSRSPSTAPARRWTTSRAAPGSGSGRCTATSRRRTRSSSALVREKFLVTSENIRAALEIEDPWESFASALRRNAEVMAADAGLRDAMVRLGPAVVHGGEAYEELDALAAQLVGRAQAAGVLRADVTVDDITALMGGLCMSDGPPRPRLATAPRAPARRAAGTRLTPPRGRRPSGGH